MYSHEEKKYTSKTSSKIGKKCNWLSKNQFQLIHGSKHKKQYIQFVITLCHYRIETMENTFGKHLIKEAITNENLSEKEIKIFIF